MGKRSGEEGGFSILQLLLVALVCFLLGKFLHG